MADLHDRWVAERRNEHYYKLAKKLNYRSRASFKLIQIDERFGIFKPGDSVVDLGACPGGWCQVAQERTWPNGKVIGVDLRYIKPIEGVETFMGDITHDSTMIELMDRFGGKADVVRFVRFERGEGLEKRQDNLAADIAAEQAKMKK